MSVFEALGTVHVKCCATCEHWLQPLNAFGNDAVVDAIRVRECLANHRHRTLDLAVCSKWQDKEEAECFDISRELSEQDQKQLRENIEQNNALLRHLKKPAKEASE